MDIWVKRMLLAWKDRIFQKTDDEAFFLFSLESYRQCGYKIISECRDLKNNPVEGDAETEHERLFKERGKNIYRIVAEA